jgi:Transposase
VAVINQDGKVLANRNVPNGVKPILSVIGDLHSGTPAAFEAAFGWGWLVELLEDYGFEPHLVHPLRCKAIASARLKNKVDAAILAQLLPADLLPEAWIAPPEVRQLRAMLRHRAQLVRLRTLLRNRIRAVLAGHGHGRPAGCWSGPGREWLASVELPAVSREVIEDALALIDALQQPIGPAGLGGASAGQVRARGQGAHPAPRRRGVHRAGPAGRDRRHHPVRLGPQAGVLGRAHPDGARQRPHRPPRAHPPSRARSGRGGSCARPRRPPSGIRSSPPATSPSRSRGKKIATTAIARSCSPAPTTCSPTPAAAVRPTSREVAKPRVSSRIRMSRPLPRSMT